jgi:hypothetical protein
MTSPNDRVLERVRKLLARAEHPSTPPAEAEAMSEKAAELMARHAIDRALIEQSDGGRHTPQRKDVQVLAPYATPKSILLTNVAAPYRVRAIVGSDNHAGRECILVGFASDLAVVELLFTSLLLQASSAMVLASEGHQRVRAFRHAFLLGYADAVGRRIRAAQQRSEESAHSSATSTALVLADRKHEVDRAVTEMFPRLRSFRPSATSGGGVAAGRAAGSRADLTAGRRGVGGVRRELC